MRLSFQVRSEINLMSQYATFEDTLLWTAIRRIESPPFSWILSTTRICVQCIHCLYIQYLCRADDFCLELPTTKLCQRAFLCILECMIFYIRLQTIQFVHLYLLASAAHPSSGSLHLYCFLAVRYNCSLPCSQLDSYPVFFLYNGNSSAQSHLTSVSRGIRRQGNK